MMQWNRNIKDNEWAKVWRFLGGIEDKRKK